MGSCESTERSMQNGNGLSSAAEIEEKKKKEMIEAAKVGGAQLVAAGLVAWGVSSFFSSGSSGSNRKMMKAPGKNGYIFRADFERDPKSYFKSLRES